MEISYSNKTIRKNVVLKDMLLLLAKHWYIYVSIMLVSLIVCTIYTFSKTAPPTYRSSGKIYVMNWESDKVTTSDLSISNYLSLDFYAIINDDYVFSKIREDLGNKYSVNQIKNFTTINFISNSRVIEIVAKSPSAQDSKLIVDSICKISKEQFANIMGQDCVKIVREASLDTNPVKPKISQNFSIAVLIGLLVCFTVVSFIYFSDTTISSADDVEKYLKLNVLATIPYNNMKAQK